MDISKTNKATWLIFCFALFSPFVIEIFVALISFSQEPRYIWGAIHRIYCYLSYGAACLLYLKWRKKIDCKIIIKPNMQDLKWLFGALVMSVAVKYIFQIIAVFVFNSTAIIIKAPMIYGEFLYYLRDDSLLLGIAGFIMQYIYYIFEFALIALTVDCAQKTSMRIGWSQKIPWGGIFLALTWGLIHRYGLVLPIFRGEFDYSIEKALLCLAVGFAYMFPGKKPIYAFLAVMAWYWL